MNATSIQIAINSWNLWYWFFDVS